MRDLFEEVAIGMMLFMGLLAAATIVMMVLGVDPYKLGYDLGHILGQGL